MDYILVHLTKISYTTYIASLNFFTGENSFALFTKLRHWKSEFTLKHGADNLLEYSGKEVSYSRIVEECSVLPFLSEKRRLSTASVYEATLIEKNAWNCAACFFETLSTSEDGIEFAF